MILKANDVSARAADENDHGCGKHLLAALDEPELDVRQAARLLVDARSAPSATRVSLMLAVSERFPMRGALAEAYLDVAGTVAWSAGRHEILAAPLDGGRAAPDFVTALLDGSFEGVSSRERSRLLVRIAARCIFDDDLLGRYLAAASRIDSSMARRDVLQAVLLGQRHRTSQMSGILRAAGQILSAAARADVLEVAASTQTIEGAARPLYLKVASTISARAHRNRAIDALTKRPSPSFAGLEAGQS